MIVCVLCVVGVVSFVLVCWFVALEWLCVCVFVVCDCMCVVVCGWLIVCRVGLCVCVVGWFVLGLPWCAVGVLCVRGWCVWCWLCI